MRCARPFPRRASASSRRRALKRNTNGSYESRQLLGDLSVGELTVLLWKARFKNFKNDVLIRMDVGELDGKILVFRLLIQ